MNAIRSRPAIIAAAAIALAWTCSVTGVSAQQQPGAPQQAEPVVKATHGDWTVRCQTLKVRAQPKAEASSSGKSDKADAEVREIEQCGMSQRVFNDKNNKIFLNIVVLKRPPSDEKAPPGEIQLVAPLGVFLPGGVAMEVDSNPIGRIGFLSCQPYGCVTVSELTTDLLEKMKKGTAANMIIYVAPGQGVPMSISLKGFTAAYDEL